MSTAELVERAKQRDAEYEAKAIEMERKGDSQLCWFYMAARAENRRFLDRLQKEMATKSTQVP